MRYRPMVHTYLCLILIAACVPEQVSAQEFRIYTRVFNESTSDPSEGPSSRTRAPIVGRSLTFFHAGKAYDYIDAVGEVIIIDPAAANLQVLSSTRMITTTLTFQQLERLNREAKNQWEKFLLMPRGVDDAETKRRLSLIEFQLRPEFQHNDDEQRHLLRLNSPQMSYEVRYTTPRNQEVVTSFLRYTDWTAQLNYVLHPQALLPGPRLALNSALREKQVIPTEVTLIADVGSGIRLRAEHMIQWELEAKDRDLIHQWKTLIASPEMREVPFREFQEILLTSQTARRN